MVIMVLIPKAIDVPASPSQAGDTPAEKAEPLTITTPEALPEAIAGRPYSLALAASGGSGSRKWSLQGQLPEGLAFDPAVGQIRGTPLKGTPEPSALVLRVSDGEKADARPARLTIPSALVLRIARWAARSSSSSSTRERVSTAATSRRGSGSG